MIKYVKSYLFLIGVVGFVGCTQQTEELPQQPNIIIFLSDDQGWGDFSINGNSNINTPNIDRLAGEGVSFNNFYVQPVCSPTRGEMLTGRYHARGGVYSTSAGGERLDLDETTIADVFKAAGYATAAYGKWHNGMQYPYHPNGRGFDDYYGFCSGHWGNYFDPMLEHNQEIVTGEGFLIDDFTNHGLEFIERNKEQPFLLYLPYNTPHAPMQVPDRWWDDFQSKELSMRAEPDKEEDIQFTKAALAMCENIDWNVGRIMGKLEELELDDNTIVIYFNDNGPNSWRWNGGMKGRKGATDEGGVRSPLFIKWPKKIQAGKRVEQIASVVDLLPTLTDMADVVQSTEKPLDGISLLPLIIEDNPDWNNRLIFNQWRDKVSVRSQVYRLDHQGGLYNIENDRGQTTEVGKLFPEVKERLQVAKDNYITQVKGELPEEDSRTFPLGHPESKITQIPARDGVAHGNILRSNRWPNCSFFTNWTSLEDKITWEVEVMQPGNYQVTLYYTCKPGNEGSEFALSHGANTLQGRIEAAHDSPLKGMENDRVERPESYVKDFKPLNLGTMSLDKGLGELTLQATTMTGTEVMDVRLLLFEKVIQ